MFRAAEPDPYTVLGVPRTATDREIRDAYLALVARYHPDRHHGHPLQELASTKMAEINRAYEVLSEPARRAAFDRTGGAGGIGDRRGGWSRNSAAQNGNGRAGSAAGGLGGRLTKIVGILLFLPLVIRFGAGAARALGALLRLALEAAGAIRGTPFALVAVLLAAIILVFALVRRRRKTARQTK